jgi:hypothetical protein
MTARMIVARQRADELFFVVHIDTQRTIDNEPNPDWVMRFRVPFPRPEEFATNADYREWIKDRLRERVKDELRERRSDTDGSALPEEGTDL